MSWLKEAWLRSCWTKFKEAIRGSFSKLSLRKNRKAWPRSRFSLDYLEDRVVPTTFTVTSLADMGAGTLRAAITSSNTAGGSNTIVFSGNAANGTIDLDSSLPAITNNLTITGPNANLLTISGQGSSQLLTIEPLNTVTISGLTLTDGVSGTGDGGAIDNLGTLTVNYCRFWENSAAAGGAIYNGETLTLTGSTFLGNSATSGAGGAIENLDTATVPKPAVAQSTTAVDSCRSMMQSSLPIVPLWGTAEVWPWASTPRLQSFRVRKLSATR
jgi:hypothetical protein